MGKSQSSPDQKKRSVAEASPSETASSSMIQKMLAQNEARKIALKKMLESNL